MPTKEQLSDDLNEMLGTNINWEKMTKEDLESVLELADSGILLEKLAKHQVQKYGKEHVENMVDEWYPGKYAGALR